MPKITEMRHNIAVGYKRYYNHHVEGMACWCRPTSSEMKEEDGRHELFIWHKNYEWINGQWYKLREPDALSGEIRKEPV